MANGTINYGMTVDTDDTAYYYARKSGKVVTVTLIPKTVTIAGWGSTTLGTLKEGFRPNALIGQTLFARNPNTSVTANLQLKINTSGAVMLENFASNESKTVSQYYGSIAFITD